MPRRNSRDPKTNPKARLGELLAQARETAGFTTQAAFAEHLAVDRTVVGKAESGERPPSGPVLEVWIKACRITNVELVVTLAELARAMDDTDPVPSWFEDWLGTEWGAVALRIWSQLLIPGLFQPAEYARALLVAEQTDTSDENIDALVAARLRRQEILDRAEPPDLVCVLDETALHRLIGSPAIMHDTLVHVAELAQRPNIVVQIVPADIGANAGLAGAFDIATCDGVPDTLRMDGVEDVTSQARALVRKASVAFDRCRGDALPRAASLTRIMEGIEQWKRTS